MFKIWKKNKIDNWTHKAHERMYKSVYLISPLDKNAAQIRYANAGRR